jgi:hypothetical protein
MGFWSRIGDRPLTGTEKWFLLAKRWMWDLAGDRRAGRKSVPPTLGFGRLWNASTVWRIGATHRRLCRAVGGGRVGSQFSLGSSQILITFEAVFRPIVPFGLPKSPSIRQIIGPFRFRTLCILVA